MFLEWCGKGLTHTALWKEGTHMVCKQLGIHVFVLSEKEEHTAGAQQGPAHDTSVLKEGQ